MSKVAGQIPLSYTNCTYCELPFTSDQSTLDKGRRRTRDHFIPRSKDGKNCSPNIYIVCQYCNLLKGNFLPNEFIYWLRCKINWKEYPGINGITFNEELLTVVKKNVKIIYEGNFVDKNLPPIPINAKKKEKKESIEFVGTKGVHYVNYLGKDCPCVGFIDKTIGNGVKQYQNVYYHSGEEKYIFVVREVGLVAYYKKTIEEYVKPFFPTQPFLRKTLPIYLKNLAADAHLSVNTNTPKVYEQKLRTHEDIVKEMTIVPQPNFHYL